VSVAHILPALWSYRMRVCVLVCMPLPVPRRGPHAASHRHMLPFVTTFSTHVCTTGVLNAIGGLKASTHCGRALSPMPARASAIMTPSDVRREALPCECCERVGMKTDNAHGSHCVLGWVKAVAAATSMSNNGWRGARHVPSGTHSKVGNDPTIIAKTHAMPASISRADK
jgi:hypothetical protein